MDMFDFDDDDKLLELNSRGRTNTGKKRRWREIETLKERQRLQKELESIDLGYEGLVEELEF